MYPALSSFSGPDSLLLQRHSLSRAALLSAQAPIYLLDAYMALLVYYSQDAPPGMPFPPPPSSLVYRWVRQLQRCVMV